MRRHTFEVTARDETVTQQPTHTPLHSHIQASAHPQIGGPDTAYSVGCAALIGQRTHQEDRVLFEDLLPLHRHAFPGVQRAACCAVFDGHSGNAAAEHLCTHFVSKLLRALGQLRSPTASTRDEQEQQQQCSNNNSPSRPSPSPPSTPTTPLLPHSHPDHISAHLSPSPSHHTPVSPSSPLSTLPPFHSLQATPATPPSPFVSPYPFQHRHPSLPPASPIHQASPLCSPHHQSHAPSPHQTHIVHSPHQTNIHSPQQVYSIAAAGSVPHPLFNTAPSDPHSTASTNSASQLSCTTTIDGTPAACNTAFSDAHATGVNGAPPASISAPSNYGAALHAALMELESELMAAHQLAGSTALVALMIDDQLHLANVGDCRAVVSDGSEARVLTRDHKPSTNIQECERLKSLGATLSVDGYVQLQVEGSSCTDLMLSRALGGAHIKKGTILASSRSDSCQQLASHSRCPKEELIITAAAAPASVPVSRVGSAAMSPTVKFAATSSAATGAEGPHISSSQQHNHAHGLTHVCSCSSSGSDKGNGVQGAAASPLSSPSTVAAQPLTVAPSDPSGAAGSALTYQSAFCSIQQEPQQPQSVTAAPTVCTTCGCPLSAALPHDTQQSGEEHSAPGIVIPTPDLFKYAIHARSEFLILASDGLWDKVRNSEAVSRVRRWLQEGCTANEAAQRLAEYAVKMDSGDNVAVVVLRFSSRPLACLGRNTHSVLRRARSEAVMSLRPASSEADEVQGHLPSQQPASHHPMPHSASVQVFSTTLTSPPPSRTHSSSLKQHDGCDGSEDSSARSSRGELEQRTSPAAHVSLAIPIMSALQQRRQTMSALPSSALPDIIESDTQQPQEGVTPLLRPSFCTLPAAHPSTLPFSSSPPKFLRV